MTWRTCITLISLALVTACTTLDDPSGSAVSQSMTRAVLLAPDDQRERRVSLFVPTSWDASVRQSASGPIMRITGTGVEAQIEYGAAAAARVCGKLQNCSMGAVDSPSGRITWTRMEVNERIGNFTAVEQLIASIPFRAAGVPPRGILLNGFCESKSVCNELQTVAESMRVN